jgi:prolyl-tRNA editing enzyme YbaK/EbsC (Cys-tRNA(Pro) deacylase)
MPRPDWPTIHVSAGRRGLEIELAAADLCGLWRAAPVARRG